MVTFMLAFVLGFVLCLCILVSCGLIGKRR